MDADELDAVYDRREGEWKGYYVAAAIVVGLGASIVWSASLLLKYLWLR